MRRSIELGFLFEDGFEGVQAIHPGFEKDLADAFHVESALSRRNAKGGTAPEAVKEQIVQARKILEND